MLCPLTWCFPCSSQWSVTSVSGRRQNHHKCHKLVVAHSHKVDLLLVFSNYISIFLCGSILLSMDLFFSFWCGNDWFYSKSRCDYAVCSSECSQFRDNKKSVLDCKYIVLINIWSEHHLVNKMIINHSNNGLSIWSIIKRTENIS